MDLLDLESLQQHMRLVFTVTTGRSGTGYLARLLGYLPNVRSYHEPEPRFSDVMRQVQHDSHVANQFWVEKKLPRIANERTPIYIETSHLFCKGFVEPLLELGVTPDLIILRRPARQVATSLYQLNIIPGRGKKGPKWVLSPEDPGVLPLPGWQTLHDYQLCYWYCLEIEHRSKRYAEMLGKINACVAQVSLSEIRTLQGFYKLLNDLDLPKPGLLRLRRFLSDLNRRVNKKVAAKSKMMKAELPEDKLGFLEDQVINRLVEA